MAVRTLRSWRAAPGTLTLIGAFALAAGVGIPLVAYLVYLRQGGIVVPILLVTLAVGALVYAWRFGVHPRLSADEFGVHVVNPRRQATFPWDEITVIASGENGLVVGSEQNQIEAWCVQKSNWASRRGRQTRSDDVVTALADLQDVYDPPLEDDETGIRIRRARTGESVLLTRLERSSNEVALAHVFPPARFPYPVADVQHRWRRVLRNRMIQVRVLELFDTPIGFVAYEPAGHIRHLAIAPHQTRRGFGSLLLEYACEEIFDSGVREATLWVLEQNTVARDFYAAHGWRETGETAQSEFEPHPDELKLSKRNPAAPRRSL